MFLCENHHFHYENNYAEFNSLLFMEWLYYFTDIKRNDIPPLLLIANFLLFIVSLTFAADVELTILTNKDGALCRLVEKSDSNVNDAYIKLLVNESITGHKISALIFRYDDLVNFLSIPTFETISQLYPSNKTQLYQNMLNDDGRSFNLDAAEGQSVDNLMFWSGTLDKDVEFSIPDAAGYCVYIAPLLTIGLEFELPVEFHKSYDSLNYIRYLRYLSLKWLIFCQF